jgi:hypothetical protein
MRKFVLKVHYFANNMENAVMSRLSSTVTFLASTDWILLILVLFYSLNPLAKIAFQPYKCR